MLVLRMGRGPALGSGNILARRGLAAFSLELKNGDSIQMVIFENPQPRLSNTSVIQTQQLV